MASDQTDDITGALDQMRDLNGRTNELLDIIRRQKDANRVAMSRMQSAATLIRRLMQGRQNMQAILAAVQGHGVDMNDSVERIIQALNGTPTVGEMEAAIQTLETALSDAEAPVPVGPAASTAAPFPGPGMVGPSSRPTGGGYRRISGMNFNTRKHTGGYNWRSSEKKKKTMTKKRNKKGHSLKRSSKRSSNKVS
jgi:TolA-binding protein